MAHALEGTDLRKVFQEDLGGGRQKNVTKCSKCHNKSEREEELDELRLHIKGHKTVKDCLRQYQVKTEMTGDNQYFCEVCNSKQDATRQTIITRMPAVLWVQLLRFEYNMVTYVKEKLKDQVDIEETLDFEAVLKDTRDDDAVEEATADGPFDLVSLIEHRGGDGSGHYVAKARDWFAPRKPSAATATVTVAATGTKPATSVYAADAWWFFDDHTVSKIDLPAVRTKEEAAEDEDASGHRAQAPNGMALDEEERGDNDTDYEDSERRDKKTSSKKAKRKATGADAGSNNVMDSLQILPTKSGNSSVRSKGKALGGVSAGSEGKAAAAAAAAAGLSGKNKRKKGGGKGQSKRSSDSYILVYVLRNRLEEFQSRQDVWSANRYLLEEAREHMHDANQQLDQSIQDQ